MFVAVELKRFLEEGHFTIIKANILLKVETGAYLYIVVQVPHINAASAIDSSEECWVHRAPIHAIDTF